MKKKIILLTLSVVAILLIIIVTVYKSSTKSSKAVVYTGYVIDQMCGVAIRHEMDMGDSDKKVDLTKTPEKHKNSCNLMPSCAESGYGISIKQADGNYKFFKFDEAGSKLAKSEIMDKTAKKDNLSVSVTGVINKDIIKISNISEN